MPAHFKNEERALLQAFEQGQPVSVASPSELERLRTSARATAIQPEPAEQAGVERLSQADQAAFSEALLTPPDATSTLERAFARRKKLLSSE